jgi:hypothetical protein
MKPLFLLVLSLKSLILFKCNNKCGDTDIFSCPDDYTCCTGPTGKICHNIKNGSCCDDLLTCCDLERSDCDNFKHECVAKKQIALLTFLGLEDKN